MGRWQSRFGSASAIAANGFQCDRLRVSPVSERRGQASIVKIINFICWTALPLLLCAPQNALAQDVQQPDPTLAELREMLAERGVSVSIATLWRFFARHGITRKKRPAMRRSRIVPTS